MKHPGLTEDFGNIRETQVYAVGKVIDEAEKYILFLEGKEDALNNVVAYLNQLDATGKNETKAEILDELVKLLPADQ